MTIYADQMFFENFVMNYVILYITSKFSGIKSKWYRSSISATIGAVYVILSYIFNFYNSQIIVTKFALATVMVLVAFKIRNIKDFFKAFAFFLGVTFLIGGASFGLAFLLNFTMISDGGVLYVEEFPIVMVVLGSALSIIIVKWTSVFLRKKLNVEELIYNIEIKILGKTLSTEVFLDSGHNVKDTFTGYPVVIIQNDKLEKIVPAYIIKDMKENNFEFEGKWKERLCIIPISTVNSENGVLIGFRADECIIHTKNGNIYLNKVVVAGCERQLDNDGKYFGLIGNVFS